MIITIIIIIIIITGAVAPVQKFTAMAVNDRFMASEARGEIVI